MAPDFCVDTWALSAFLCAIVLSHLTLAGKSLEIMGSPATETKMIEFHYLLLYYLYNYS